MSMFSGKAGLGKAAEVNSHRVGIADIRNPNYQSPSDRSKCELVAIVEDGNTLTDFTKYVKDVPINEVSPTAPASMYVI